MVENNLFTREIEVLLSIVPALHRALNTSSTEKPILLGPRCYFFSGKPHQKLVMEDLSESGFKMASRMSGLDLDHSKLVISRLGQFHAASVALHSQEPGVFEKFLTNVFVGSNNHMTNLLSESLKSVAEKVQNWPEVGHRYFEKLRQLSETGVHRLEKAVKRDDQDFNVLTHGDTWTNNMMFRYNEDGKVSDMIFLDFQCCYYGSPVLDLHYFLYTSPTPEVRSRHMDELVECYHSSLSKTLARLGCGSQCPSLEIIREKMIIRNFMGVFTVFCIKPLTSANPDNTPDIADLFVSPSENYSSAHLTEDYMRELTTLLPILEKDGLLD
ncbi:hypothetical protein PR048_032789 [Dryococelus australis]|uniref:CHK kinase-like domain-containing protein n=1 Tax=Dryococelus australis TaxID=614101 RepID=A0ABQ9G4C7_9NEOP|nr:hypothetical protein PR048_032789 [Dryococelus australis]